MSNQEKTIYIIGAGAIGKVLAVLLQLQGRQVILIRGSVNNGEQSLQKISVVLDDQILNAEVQVSTLNNFKVLDGIIIITAKSFGNENLSHQLKGKTGNTPVVLLQNGLGVETPFNERDFPELYRCVLFVTSQLTDDNLLRFKPVAGCPVGIIRGCVLILQEIVDTLTTPEFRFLAERDIQKIVWKKAIVNSVFNSVCPLLETDNGIFYRNTTAKALARRVIAECLIVARAKGIALQADEILESLLNISKSADGQLISTLQDIRRGRPTEIATLNGAIMAMAQQMDIDHLLPETRLLGEMTELKAALNMQP